jgi:hypothetical protein
LKKPSESLIAMTEKATMMTEEEIAAPDMVEMSEAEDATTTGLRERTNVQRELQAVPAPATSASPLSLASPTEAVAVEQADMLAAAEPEMIMQDEIEIALDRDMAAILKAAVVDSVAIAGRQDEAVVERRAVAASRAGGMTVEAAKASVPVPQIGMEAYEKYLKEAMIPPKKEECANPQGIVEVEFTLKTGKPTGFLIKQSLCDAADKEAIRLIENGSQWIGQDGQQVVLKVIF